MVFENSKLFMLLVFFKTVIAYSELVWWQKKNLSFSLLKEFRWSP